MNMENFKSFENCFSEINDLFKDFDSFLASYSKTQDQKKETKTKKIWPSFSH